MFLIILEVLLSRLEFEFSLFFLVISLNIVFNYWIFLIYFNLFKSTWFRDSEPQGIRISSKQQVTNKLISASPASNFISAKDKANAHRTYIDNQRNQVQTQSDSNYSTQNNKVPKAIIYSNLDSEEDEEENLINQMMTVRKINLQEPSRL